MQGLLHLKPVTFPKNTEMDEDRRKYARQLTIKFKKINELTLREISVKLETEFMKWSSRDNVLKWGELQRNLNNHQNQHRTNFPLSNYTLHSEKVHWYLLYILLPLHLLVTIIFVQNSLCRFVKQITYIFKTV